VITIIIKCAFLLAFAGVFLYYTRETE